MRSSDPELADAVAVLASTGMRKAELLGLQWADVDLVKVRFTSPPLSPMQVPAGILRKATKRSDWRDVPLTRRRSPRNGASGGERMSWAGSARDGLRLRASDREHKAAAA